MAHFFKAFLHQNVHQKPNKFFLCTEDLLEISTQIHPGSRTKDSIVICILLCCRIVVLLSFLPQVGEPIYGKVGKFATLVFFRQNCA